MTSPSRAPVPQQHPTRIHEARGSSRQSHMRIDAALVRTILHVVMACAGLASCGTIGYFLGISAVVGLPNSTDGGIGIEDPGAGRRRNNASPNEKSPPLRGGGNNNGASRRRLGTNERGWSATPSDWESMTYSELRRYYACSEHARDQGKELPSLEDWMFLKKQYREIVGDGRAPILDSPISPTMGYSFRGGGGGSTTTTTKSDPDGGGRAAVVVPPPYRAAMSRGKGRGLFASKFIRRGEMVHDGPNSNVMFPNADSFRRLIVSLPRKTACDITEWAWTQRLSKDGEMRIFVDLNIAALMNTSREPNIAPKDGTSTQMYATRDIYEGEEISYDYRIYPTDWSAVGLG